MQQGRIRSWGGTGGLVAGKFDGSKARRGPGRPRVDAEIEQLIIRMAKENLSWGYDRIVGALANLSDRNQPPRSITGRERWHMDLAALTRSTA